MTARLDAIRKTPFRWWDLAIYGVVLVCILATVWVAASRASEPLNVVEVYVDGVIYATVDLATDKELDVDGRLTLVVKGGTVTVKDAHCPDKVCQSMHIGSVGQQIVCLPQSVVVLARSGIGSGEIEVG